MNNYDLDREKRREEIRECVEKFRPYLEYAAVMRAVGIMPVQFETASQPEDNSTLTGKLD